MEYVMTIEGLQVKPFELFLTEAQDTEGSMTPGRNITGALDRTSAERMLKEYVRDSEFSKGLRKEASESMAFKERLKKDPAAKIKWGTVYSIYNGDPTGFSSFVFYDHEMERTFELLKPNTIDGKPNTNQWQMIIGDKFADKTDAERGSRTTAELKNNFNVQYTRWKKYAIEDLVYGKRRLSSMALRGATTAGSGGNTFQEQHPMLWDLLVSAVGVIRSTDLTKNPAPLFKMTDAEGKQIKPAPYGMGSKGNDPREIAKFNRSHSISAHEDWRAKYIGPLFRSGDKPKTGSAVSVSAAILAMGLISEDYNKEYNNTDLLRIFDALIQRNPYTSTGMKQRWAETLENLYKEFYPLTNKEVKDVKTDAYDLEDENLALKYNSPEVRSDLRLKLLHMMKNSVLAAENLGVGLKSYGGTSTKDGITPFGSRDKNIKEDLYIPSFYEFLFEEEDSYRRKYGEQQRKTGFGKYTGYGEKGIAIDKQFGEIESKLREGVYVPKGEIKLDQVIFDAISTPAQGYVVLKYNDNGKRYSGRTIPSPDNAKNFIPGDFADKFILKGGNGYVANGTKGGEKAKPGVYDDAPGVILRSGKVNTEVLLFDTKEEAYEYAKQAAQELSVDTTPITFAEAYTLQITEDFNRIQKLYRDNSENVFYVNPDESQKEGAGFAMSTANIKDDVTAYNSFVTAAFNALHHKTSHDVAMVHKGKEDIKQEREQTKTGVYSAVSKNVSPELADDLSQYGHSPDIAADTTLAKYLEVSADMINKLMELGSDIGSVEHFTKMWKNMADMVFETAGEKFDVNKGKSAGITEDEISQIADLEDDKAIKQKSIVEYAVTKAYLQMFIRQIGDDIATPLGLKNKMGITPGAELSAEADKYLKQDYVASTSLPDLWTKYMTILDGMDKNEIVTKARNSMLDTAASALMNMGTDPEMLDEEEVDYEKVSKELEMVDAASAGKFKNLLAKAMKKAYDVETTGVISDKKAENQAKADQAKAQEEDRIAKEKAEATGKYKIGAPAPAMAAQPTPHGYFTEEAEKLIKQDYVDGETFAGLWKAYVDKIEDFAKNSDLPKDKIGKIRQSLVDVAINAMEIAGDDDLANEISELDFTDPNAEILADDKESILNSIGKLKSSSDKLKGALARILRKAYEEEKK